jgi:UDP-2,3-diacylglucosamine hydrolase
VSNLELLERHSASDGPRKRVGHVVSDLHLLTRRSTAAKYLPVISRAVHHSEVFVLNGDIFDFKWSTHRGAVASVDAATGWLRRLADSAHACQFAFVVGNHDCKLPFLEALDDLAGDVPNFRWEPHYLRIGDKLFLHGDVVNGFVTPSSLAAVRRRWDRVRPRGPFLHAVYSAVTKTRIYSVLPHLLPKRRCARRLVAYLRLVLGEEFGQLRDVYFGHTHRAFTGYRFDGIRFHNTGAAVTGARLRVLKFHVLDEDTPLVHEPETEVYGHQVVTR